MSIDAKFNIHRGTFTLEVDLSIPEQGIIGLFGPSGCGKTTLLRAIAGLERHLDGYLKVGDIIWQEKGHFIPPHRRSLGYVFQEASLFPHLNVRRNLEYGVKRAPSEAHKISLEQVIGLLDIEHLLERNPGTLSGGERQRVAMARALAISPRLLLMDEPLASLDLLRKQEFLPYLESLHNELNIPVIYVSHSHSEMARLADHLVLLESGRVIATGPVHEIFTRLDLPLAHDHGAEALIEATVVEHDDEYHLTYLEFSGGRFAVAHKSLPIGNSARLRIAARDVSLTLTSHPDSSMLNIFPATVNELVPEGKAQVIAKLRVGNALLLAHITRKSSTQLDLQVGKRVYAQVKSVALLP